MQEQEIRVYTDLNGEPVYVGRLFSRMRGRSESASFAYDPSWLRRSDAFEIDPALPLGDSVQHTIGRKPMFGAFEDCAPDRWGRNLMLRAERRRASKADETPRSLGSADYLLRVNDFARQGALRFCWSNSPTVFQAPSTETSIPPLIELQRLLSAAQHVEANTDTDDDLRMLLNPGSSLGGARPKASVIDANGQLAIAKFPSVNDHYNVVRWEAVALALAEKAGIEVPGWRVEQVAHHDVLILARFDRRGGIRIPYQSAMTMLRASDNENHSYLEIVDHLSAFGATPVQDKEALWRRVVFNVLISNTDDHLRNHGFLRDGAHGWRLSPAFDMNPVPVDVKPRVLQTAIGVDEDEASLPLALEYASYYGLSADGATRIAAEVGQATAQWRAVAHELGITGRECERMASAFEHVGLSSALSPKPQNVETKNLKD